MKNLRLAVTCGDPAGVGPELIQKCLADLDQFDGDITVVGPHCFLNELKGDAFETLEVGDHSFSSLPGKPTKKGAGIAIQALDTAANGCKTGQFDAVVTGPISKAWCVEAGFSFPGQTEFFAEAWGGAPTMGFVGDRLKVVLATWHVPLMEVGSVLTKKALLLAVERADDLCKRLSIASPKIGVAGLNPHAGEGGILGREEEDWINPFLAEMRSEFPGVSDCVPGDTVFGRALKGEFDVVVALYHDQGLAPLKTIDFDSAVNVTLGLPFVRTSPDHGTAFDIAGRGIASSRSFSNAISLACRLARKGSRASI